MRRVYQGSGYINYKVIINLNSSENVPIFCVNHNIPLTSVNLNSSAINLGMISLKTHGFPGFEQASLVVFLNWPSFGCTNHQELRTAMGFGSPSRGLNWVVCEWHLNVVQGGNHQFMAGGKQKLCIYIYIYVCILYIHRYVCILLYIIYIIYQPKKETVLTSKATHNECVQKKRTFDFGFRNKHCTSAHPKLRPPKHIN